ncbi:MAG: hypothetical protein EOM87_04520 [Clostridia bacterium]|nr:hypothetical protein [Clostridia bacterium]
MDISVDTPYGNNRNRTLEVSMEFGEYLKNEKQSENIIRALTDRSCKNSNTSLTDKDINRDLATLGDAIIKLRLTYKFLDKVDKLSEHKKQYEEDEFLVTKVAKSYGLLEYMRFDKTNVNIIKNYDYNKKTNNNNPHKYIATAVEAMIGAIYLDTLNFIDIDNILDKWMKIN